MEKLKKPLKFSLPSKLSDLWFQHESPYWFDLIKVPTYTLILKNRAEDLGMDGAIEYVSSRKQTEEHYNKLIPLDKKNKSFTYCSILGFHKMGTPDEYPGFTYYFKLNEEQLDKTIIEIVSGNKKFDIGPDVGKKHLEKCLSYWIKNKNKFKPYYDEVVGGNIDPRVEIVLSFDVKPICYYPEQEQR